MNTSNEPVTRLQDKAAMTLVLLNGMWCNSFVCLRDVGALKSSHEGSLYLHSPDRDTVWGEAVALVGITQWCKVLKVK